MRLRGKIVTAVLAVVVLYGAIDYAVERWVILPQFVALERDEALKDVDRCRRAIDQELDHLTLLCRDWASWDDSYQFMADRNQQYQKSTLTPEVFLSSDLNLAYYYRPSGESIWGKAFSLSPLREVPLPKFDAQMQANGRAFITHADIRQAHQGLIMTRLGPMMVASLPILKTDLKGPPRGSLVMGRLLTDDLLQKLSRQIHVPIHHTTLENSPPSLAAMQALARFGKSRQPSVIAVDDRSLAGFLHLQDLDGRPILQLRLDLPRDISTRGRQAIEFADWSLLAGGALVLFLLLLIIQRIVVAPVHSLTKHAMAIAASGDLALRVRKESDDEVGQLALEFNRMMDRLADSNRRLIELSRKAGMAQVASGVLHNIGNVLAGVSCLTESLKTALENSRMHKLPQLSELLRNHACDFPRFVAEDPRGQQVLPYIGQLAARWQEESTRLRSDIDNLIANVQHITAVVATQQQFASRAQVTEPTHLESVIAEATMLCERSLAKHGVALRKTIEPDLPVVSIDRTRLLEVLVNLVTNAKESLSETIVAEPSIRVSLQRFTDEWVRIEIQDNGGGIAPENLANIFRQEFTTKDKGGGFGLHFSALAIKDMGGAISARSPGIGMGATFTIDLPRSPPREQTPALSAAVPANSMPLHPSSYATPIKR
jgi:two-component system, NtrC family, sensor kinase